MIKLLLSSGTFAFLCFSKVVFSQWEPAGLQGHPILSLTSNRPNKIYAGTADSGLFWSNNRGDEWKGSALPFDRINLLASLGPENIFAAINQGGITRSTDSGASWGPVIFPNSVAYSLFTDSTMGVFSGILNFQDSIGGQIYYSQDTGKSWIRRDSSLSSACMISFLRLSSTRILAGSIRQRVFVDKPPPNEWSFNGGLFNSEDNGTTWQKIWFDSVSVSALARTRGGNILAGTYLSGIFRSSDEGGTWNSVNSGLSTSSERNIRHLSVNSNGQIFAATLGGVFVSIDSGKSWEAMNGGLQSLQVFDLVFDDSEYAIAGTAAGAFRTLGPITSVLESGETPLNNYELYQNYPNPFNFTTEIQFELRSPAEIVLRIFNVAGRQIRILQTGKINPGIYRTMWDGLDDRGLSAVSGAYFCQLLIANNSIPIVQMKKLLLLK